LSAFASRFQQSRIRELPKFFGQEGHHFCPPPPLSLAKSEGARTPMPAGKKLAKLKIAAATEQVLCESRSIVLLPANFAATRSNKHFCLFLFSQ